VVHVSSNLLLLPIEDQEIKCLYKIEIGLVCQTLLDVVSRRRVYMLSIRVSGLICYELTFS
jgi:hypothetical protein